jgi:hypothetical protein
MTRTAQLEAHLAVVQIDSLFNQVVLSFQPTCDMVIAEWHEQYDGRHPTERCRSTAIYLARYRAAVIELGSVLTEMRAGCGSDKDDLPAGDDDARREFNRIVAAQRAHASRLSESEVPF